VRVNQHSFAALALAAVVIASISSGGCGSSSGGLGPPGGSSSGSSSSGGTGFGLPDDDGGSSSGLGGGGSGSGSFTAMGTGDASSTAPTCSTGTGWLCSVDKACSNSSQTTLTGKVFDPAGNNPLYNALVFVPNVQGDLPTITPGTSSCNACDASVGNYVAIGETNAEGEFTLTGVPTGNGVPVTVQMGKWRRTVNLNITKSCATNTVPDGTLRLPRTHMEGDMPQMALLTGGCDDMACFLTGIGIDPTEFTAPHAGGRVDVYQGLGLAGNGAALSNGTAGNCTTSSCPLWQSKSSFEAYDIALFSCECNEQKATKPTSALQALASWLNEGGKVFASHYHYYWFQSNPEADIAAVATWNVGSTIASGSGTYDINNVASFPKGQVFGEWLGAITPTALASTGTPDTIDLQFVATSMSTINTATAQDWIYDPSTSPNDVKYLSFDTPIGGIAPSADAGESSTKNYCGKAVFTDLHTGGALLAKYNSIPAQCPTNTKLTAQQAAMEFLFFDLSACVSDDTKQPPAPPMQAPQ
jgi:hypothetical protein